MSTKRTVVAAAVAVILVAVPAVGGERFDDGPEWGWCNPDGAWLGSAPSWGLSWTQLVESTSWRHGTINIEWIGGDATFQGLCPGAVTWSLARGVSKRVGPRTFEFSIISYSLDAAGQPVCIVKNSGLTAYSQDCKSGETNGAIELFYPGDNPFEDPPFFCIPPIGNPTVVRMRVDPPCAPLD